MKQLKSIYDPSELSTHKVYKIKNTLCRYVGKDVWAKIHCDKYVFSPLPGQRRKNDIKLTRNKVRGVVLEVPGMHASKQVMVTPQAIQMTLF